MNADTPLRHMKVPWTRLPFVFGPGPLRSELDTIPEDSWVPHFNQADYAGEWSSVSLRSKSGRANDISPSGLVSEFADTPLMASCRSLRDVVETFEFPKKSVRLLRLRAGSRVKEHSDRDLDLADGELRIHVPVQTNDQVEFVVANRRLPLRAGEAWYIDFSQPHRIENAGEGPRVHLIIDGTLNEWAEDLLLRSVREIVTETFEPAGIQELNQFRELVYNDAELRSQLLQETEPEKFLEAVVAAGLQRGYDFKLADAESLYNLGRREWAQRSMEL